MDSFSANALLGVMPDLIINLPYAGMVDITRYVLAAGVFVALYILFQAVQRIVLIRLDSWATKTVTDIDNVVIAAVEGIRSWVYVIIALYVSLQFFTLPSMLDYVVTGAILFAIVWQAIEVITTLIEFFTKRFLEKPVDGEEIDPNAANASNLISLVAKIVLWSLGVLFVLSNLGIEVTSLIAGLGIGGIAVAFALQGVLSDLFASFSIYFDKPFRIGDFVVTGGDAGVVEHIGIMSTRLRTLQGEQLVISNNELTTARVQNFKKMDERRIVSQFGVTYETDHDKVKQIPEIVRTIFSSIESGRLDRVHFTTFADSSLLFEVVYYVETPDYTKYLDIQQEFNFALMDKFAALEIDFAYPTQTIYTKQVS